MVDPLIANIKEQD